MINSGNSDSFKTGGHVLQKALAGINKAMAGQLYSNCDVLIKVSLGVILRHSLQVRRIGETVVISLSFCFDLLIGKGNTSVRGDAKH
jgi:hypothetical protein